MHGPHVVTKLTHAIRQAFAPVINAERRAEESLRKAFHGVSQFGSDVLTAIRDPKAMDPGKRRIDETKIAAGFINAVEGPIAMIVGVAAIAEGIYDLDVAGHDYRISQTSPAPASNSPHP